jgi:hypothetical protein
LYILAALALPVAPLVAQGKSTITSAKLENATIAAKPTVSREAVRSFLGTDQAKKAAAQLGVSTEVLSARVAKLDQATLNLFAERAQVDDSMLAGGRQTIVISVTTVIIILLLLILITD